jgi:DNA polymerase-4
MDAFYASVEERENPALRGQPVIVGGPRDARGVVSAANYAARKFGVHSAMPLRVASRLCPDGVFLPGRMKLYAEASRAVFAIFHRYSPAVEPLSIDEAFLDATGCERLYGGPVELAKVIRAAIREEVSLTASVGVAPNKFIAKIASDLDKPDGLVVVPPGEVEAFLAPLPVERMWGIGPKGAQELRARGIRTFADLAGANLDGLFPRAGAALRGLATGRDVRPVVTERAPKSVGHETTFMENVTDEDVVHRTLVSLTDRVAGRLRHHGLRARTVTLKVRYAPFRTFTRRVTLPAPTCATTDLLETVLALWKDKAPEHGVPVRLLGVSTSGFSAQATLFAAPEAPRHEALDNAVDRVREKFGTAAVRRASVMRDG